MRKATQWKVGLIILSSVIALLPVLFQGAVDDFAPYQTAATKHVYLTGEISGSFLNRIPGFYALGAIFLHISGMAPAELPVAPLLLVPIAITLFTLGEKISDSPLIASLGAAAVLFLGIRGSSTAYYWPHGFGDVLIFSAVLVVLYQLREEDVDKERIATLHVVLAAAIVFMSYNRTFRHIVFFGILAGLLWVSQRTSTSDYSDWNIQAFIGVVAIAVFFVVAISRFFIEVFLEIVVGYTADISTFEKLLTSLFSTSTQSSSLAQILHSNPPELTYLAISRYIVIGLALLYLLASIVRILRQRERIPPVVAVLVALAGASTIYIIVRIFIGSVAIPAIYLPGLLTLLWLTAQTIDAPTKRVKRFGRPLAVIGLIVVVVGAPLYYGVALDAGMVNRGQYGSGTVEEAGDWQLQYAGDGRVYSDEWTRGIIHLRYIDEQPAEAVDERLLRVRNEDAVSVVQLSERPPRQGYYHLNHDLSHLQLDNWVYIDPWRLIGEPVGTHPELVDVYDNGGLEVYYRGNDTEDRAIENTTENDPT